VIKIEFEKVIYERRTIRRYKKEPISMEILKKLIDYARLAPAAANKQSLEYIIVKDPQMRSKLFPLLRWAAYLPKDQRTPKEDERPMAYIIVLNNIKIKKNVQYNIGAAIENILLGATSFGLGACWMGSIDKIRIRELFKIPKHYKITHVISLGVPDEKSKVEPYEDTFKYWKDEKGIMHVPKRSSDEVIQNIY
jgi:nitroreductase